MTVLPLPRATPESRGVSSAAIGRFIEASEKSIDHLHSLILLRDGHVIAEGWWRPYAPEYPHMLFSLSKSFTSTAVGLAVHEGRLTIDDRVIDFFPEDTPSEISEHLAALRVRHLLSMGAGHAVDPLMRDLRTTENWVRSFLEQPIEVAPGSRFLYSSGATYMCAAILHKLTGESLLEYLRPRLFDPLGIEHATWQSCPRGINVGGWGLSVTTDAIARFGQLYLQQGRWQGQQLVSADWIAQATSAQISNAAEPAIDWTQGYGFQFWRCRHNAYRGDGAFGQYCIVMPDQNTVLAMTSGVADMQAVLNLVWEQLLPALGPGPLPVDSASQAALRNKLSSLTLPVPEGQPSSQTEKRISGTRFVCEPNDQQVESVTLTFDEAGATLTVHDHRGDHLVVCGRGEWRDGETTLDYGEDSRSPMAAAGAWENDSTFVIKLAYVQTPFIATIRCQLEGDQLRMTDDVNVSFGPARRVEVVGRAE
jgi:CubicO group peptidase (beta-lactamase class C family)